MSRNRSGVYLFAAVALLGGHSAWTSGAAQGASSSQAPELYTQIRSFALTGGVAEVSALSLARDRVQMTFTGTFYFAAPIGGRVTGAVFVGQGTMRAEVPQSSADFERKHVQRMIGADLVESDFRTAVLRWTDDTFDRIGAARRDGPAVEQATRLAAELESRVAVETGANLAARLTTSLLNEESPGVFFARFDGGRRNRFSVLLDHQNRLPVASFSLNGGEKGVIFSYQPVIFSNDVWMAFYAENDYTRGAAEYSDTNDLVDIRHYRLDADVRELDRRMRLSAGLEMTARVGNLRAVSFALGEGLSGFRDARLKNQLRVKAVRVGGQPVAWAQEDWEAGFTAFLPAPVAAGDALTLDVDLEGAFIQDADIVPECYYPRSNTSWYPRHGYLDRATFDLAFRHRKRDQVASVGVRVSQEAADAESVVTTYQMSQPVALVVFAIGPFERHVQNVNWDIGGEPIPVEFNSVPARVAAIKHDFVLAELDNSVRYFAAMFGRYPYERFGAAFHPFGYGQGFPTLLMIPPADRATTSTFGFIAHETAHQWWGNIVAWRSYRDQWLSEGFAEYSGILYTGLRDKPQSATDMIRARRESLKRIPRTLVGVGSGRLNDIGPIVLGHRLNTSKSFGAYQALVYDKGALVLRMLHFLFTHPTTGDDKAFSAMMTDFVNRHRDGTASTDDFRAVASDHFARTPVAQKYNLSDLNWFFRQWVYETGLPSYQLDYTIASQDDGSVLLSGTVTQENVANEWFMPLPVVISFEGNQQARTTVHALGPSTPFQLKLPSRPRRVELDPAEWILSERTTTRGR